VISRWAERVLLLGLGSLIPAAAAAVTWIVLGRAPFNPGTE
jgi:hypothetical protein